MRKTTDFIDSLFKRFLMQVSRILLIVFMIWIFPQQLYAEEQPIRVGATVSLEGQYKKLSHMVKKGYELWAEEVNARGGILGRSVEFIFYDDKSQVELVGPLYEKLITEDHVDLVLSPYGSSLTFAAAEVTEKHKKVMMASTASALQIWNKNHKYIFGIYATADRYFIGFLDLIARSGMKTVGVVYENSTFNIAAANGVRSWAEMFGLEITYLESFNDPDEELQNIVKLGKSHDFDGLVFCGYPPEGFKFLNYMQAEGYRPKAIAMAIAPTFGDFYKKVGVFANGIFGPSQWEADERLPFPDTARFIRKFKTLTGQSPTYHACAAYSAGQILEKAILQAQNIDHDEIRNFVTSLDTITIMGRFKVDHRGSQIGHNPILIQWQKGKKEIVYPTKMRTAPAQFAVEK